MEAIGGRVEDNGAGPDSLELLNHKRMRQKGVLAWARIAISRVEIRAARC